MSAGGKAPKWQASARWIPEKPDSGELYASFSYFLHERVAVGFDYRPLVDKVALNANVRALVETKDRPGIVLGTATDEFGDVASRHYYGTVSKYMGEWNSIGFSPYAGAAFIEELDELRGIGGLHMRYEDWSAMWQYTGVDLHFTTSYQVAPGHVVSFIAFDMDKLGLAYFVRM